MKIRTGYIVCLLGTLLLGGYSGRGAAQAQQPEKAQAQAANADDNAKKYDEFFKKADYYLGKNEFEKSIENCKAALLWKPQDSLARALMCLDYYYLGEALDVKKSGERARKNEMYQTMIRIAEEGIRAEPQRGECYFMRGLAYARLATTKGVLYSLFTAKGMERDWLQAAKFKSEYKTPTGENLDASCHIALAAYYRLCPSFFLLKLVFGISGDLDKSVEHALKAYELDPRIEAAKECGLSLITRGLDRHNTKDIEDGKNYLRLVPTLPVRLSTDQVDVEHSRLLLADISLCPGYSRDQQQDISEENFKKIQAEKKKQAGK